MFSGMNPQRFALIDLEIVSQSLKSGKTQKVSLWRFIYISSLNGPEISPVLVSLSIGYHGNDDRHKNFDFSFCYIFPSSIDVESFPTIK